MNPKHLILLQRAQALDRAGKSSEAAMAYRSFLEKEPDHPDAWADYAGKLLSLGQIDTAEQACTAALKVAPNHLSALINLGCVLLARNQRDEAEGQFRKVLTLDPWRMDAQLLLAECLLKKWDLEQAGLILKQISLPGGLAGDLAVLKPRCAELWANLAAALSKTHRFPEAEEACHAALQVDPRNLRAKATRGSIQMAMGALDKAEEHFRLLLAEQPGNDSLRLLWISSLARSGDWESADREIAKVLRKEPRNFAVHKFLFVTFSSHGRWPQFQVEIERFRKIHPASPHLVVEQGLMDLLFGDLRQGLQRYEARFDVYKDLGQPVRTLMQPQWDGTCFAGKTLLLWTEQGSGDTIMFLRYLPLVKALGGRVILEVPPALMALASTCPGADLVVPLGSPLPPFDLQSTLVSLPRAFGTELDSIPAEVPYLEVPANVPHRREIFEQLVKAQSSTRVGLVWAGNPDHPRDDERSLAASALAPFEALLGVAWFSLQVGRWDLPPLTNLVSLAPLLRDFSDTAYALSSMDLLISVDTSVAHLAGAMGIPTLLLLPFQPDFRWLLDRDDSPWYPTLRLYRQPTYGDWASVVNQVITDLTQDS
jgi:tetratricopeptide (TPR) repeat protein